MSSGATTAGAAAAASSSLGGLWRLTSPWAGQLQGGSVGEAPEAEVALLAACLSSCAGEEQELCLVESEAWWAVGESSLTEPHVAHPAVHISMPRCSALKTLAPEQLPTGVAKARGLTALGVRVGNALMSSGAVCIWRVIPNSAQHNTKHGIEIGLSSGEGPATAMESVKSGFALSTLAVCRRWLTEHTKWPLLSSGVSHEMVMMLYGRRNAADDEVRKHTGFGYSGRESHSLLMRTASTSSRWRAAPSHGAE
eukprot:CAMPEP_0119358846 /NCGR_PEP_ID=MMETSP1334-20130426/6913_2 /TAXON_ID=127549 /ORGANISM="Calcidiscus leptoporus, Strain RCC1130" /LENGTH=252 /DNA_ID=CAMNT_0007373405 /DNA_START=377 /DNA_END=1137 /DNA_ORIENTATION=-